MVVFQDDCSLFVPLIPKKSKLIRSMKHIIVYLFVLSFAAASAQQVAVDVHRAYGKPVRPEQLKGAKTMDDFIAYFPHDWVEQYVKTTVSLDQSGKIQTAEGKSDRFSAGQVKLLSTAGIGDRITVSVDYRRSNPINGKPETQGLSYAFTVVPDQEAQHTLPEVLFKKQFTAPLASSMPEPKDGEAAIAKVRFVVLENGQIANVALEQSCGNATSDKFIVEKLKSMARWKPAQNKDGRTFRQELVLVVNNSGC